MRLSGWILYAIGSMGFCQYEKFKILTILTKKGRKTDVMKTKRHGSGTGGLKKISNFFKRNNFLGLNFYFNYNRRSGAKSQYGFCDMSDFRIGSH